MEKRLSPRLDITLRLVRDRDRPRLFHERSVDRCSDNAGRTVCRIWPRDRPTFLIVEQGAHHGEFATDVLEALHAGARNFLRCCVTESWSRFPILRQRHKGAASFAGKMNGPCSQITFSASFSNDWSMRAGASARRRR